VAINPGSELPASRRILHYRFGSYCDRLCNGVSAVESDLVAGLDSRDQWYRDRADNGDDDAYCDKQNRNGPLPGPSRSC
jgi:hypothetical protein